MNLNFIPYKLNDDVSSFEGKIEYINSYNGIDHYRTQESFIRHLLGFPVYKTNLYFFEGNLITVYMQLNEMAGSLHQVKGVLEKAILVHGKIMEVDSGFIHYWQAKSQFLGLMIMQDKNILLLYHSMNKFNAFRQ